jgi:hypothetical protein
LREDAQLRKGQSWERFEMDEIVKWWKNKATKRYDTIKADGRLRTELEVWRKNNIDTIDIIR